MEAAFRSWFIANDGRNELQKSGGSNSRKQVVQLSSRSISAGNLVFCLDKRDVCCRPTAYSRHPFAHARTASASVLRPPRRAGAGKAVFSFDSVLQFVVERFDKLGDQLWRRRQCLWAWCLSVYRRDSASLGPNALWLDSQPVRCHRTSAAIARDILPDVNWP